MKIQTNNLKKDQIYKLLTGTVAPRPIAWITTLNKHGKINLAPYSIFTFVTHAPPCLGFGIAYTRPEYEEMKDTERNIRNNKEFVINIASAHQADLVEKSAVDYPEDISEVELLGLRTLPSDTISVPRLADVKISVECALFDIVRFGNDTMSIVVGEAKLFHVSDELFDDNGIINTFKLNPLLRVAGPNYATLGDPIKLSSK